MLTRGSPIAFELLASWDDTWSDANDDGLYDDPGLSIFNAWWDIALKNTFEDEFGEYWGAVREQRGRSFQLGKEKTLSRRPSSFPARSSREEGA